MKQDNKVGNALDEKETIEKVNHRHLKQVVQRRLHFFFSQDRIATAAYRVP